MPKRFCKWLALRLIMATQSRAPLTYYRPRRWELFSLAGRSLELVHMKGNETADIDGVAVVLLGELIAEKQESPRHLVLTEVGDFLFRPVWAELPERGNCWFLNLSKSHS